jgi:WD40 repeat protein
MTHISQDGKRIVSVSADKTARVWDIETGASLMTLDGQSGMLGSVAFSPDGTRIVTGGESGRIGGSGTIHVWDAVSGAELITLFGHLRRVTGVAFTPDGKRIVSGSFDGTIKIWEPDVDPTAPVTLDGRHGSMAFSRDGKYIVTGGKDKTVRVWDATSHDKLMEIEGAGTSISLSPDAERIISADGNDINVWHVSSGNKLMTLSGHDKAIWALSYSPDGTRIVSGGLDKTVRLWNADTGMEILTMRGHTDSPFMEGSISPVAAVAFCPHGKLIASGSYDYTVKIWNAVTGAEVLTIDKHSSLVNDVTFSPDGKRLASASSDRTIRICDVKTGNELLVLKGHEIEALSVAFSPDGKRIVSGSKDETIRIWDAETGTEVQRLSIGGSVWDLSFSPDGKTLAAASERVKRTGYTITLWESAVSTGEDILSRTDVAMR